MNLTEAHHLMAGLAEAKMLREAAFKMIIAIIEGELRKAEYHAQTVLTLISHLKQKSQE